MNQNHASEKIAWNHVASDNVGNCNASLACLLCHFRKFFCSNKFRNRFCITTGNSKEQRSALSTYPAERFQSQDFESCRYHHPFLSVVRCRDPLEALQSIHRLLSSVQLVRKHAFNKQWTSIKRHNSLPVALSKGLVSFFVVVVFFFFWGGGGLI